MRVTVLLSLILSSFFLSSAFAQLQKGQIAYYGADFYQNKVTKDLLSKILNENHTVIKGSHDIISSNCQGTCYRHTSVGYTEARKILFGELFIQKDRNGNFVQDVYCGKKFYFTHVNDVSNMHTEVNIEHTWPQSRFNGNFDKNMQKSDMHHLFPTDSMANNRRANHEFGDVPEQHDELNVENCSISRLSDISGHFIFTPPAHHRGNVARSLFYFATRYRLFIKPAEEMILKMWHRTDPVDDAERARHELIVNHQKVRNPFVDYT